MNGVYKKNNKISLDKEQKKLLSRLEIIKQYYLAKNYKTILNSYLIPKIIKRYYQKILQYLTNKQIVKILYSSNKNIDCVAHMTFNYPEYKSREFNFTKNSIKNNSINGIYIFGPPGSGKTMIAQKFWDSCNVKKKMYHYQNFIQMIYKSCNSNTEISLYNYAYELSINYKLLFIDEIEIKDIGDAMIMGRFLQYSITNNLFIIMTSNTHLSNLYKNGFQYELFYPFIQMLKNYFIIYPLSNNIDYRDTKAQKSQRILTDEAKFNKIIKNILSHMEHTPKTICFKGRTLNFNKVYTMLYDTLNIKLNIMDILETQYHLKTSSVNTAKIQHLSTQAIKLLETSFEQICQSKMYSADYIEICNYFDIIVLHNLNYIKSYETEKIIRFIHLIDNIYFHKNVLYMSMQYDIENIYTAGCRYFEFQRTISRIKEMNSADYKHKLFS